MAKVYYNDIQNARSQLNALRVKHSLSSFSFSQNSNYINTVDVNTTIDKLNEMTLSPFISSVTPVTKVNVGQKVVYAPIQAISNAVNSLNSICVHRSSDYSANYTSDNSSHRSSHDSSDNGRTCNYNSSVQSTNKNSDYSSDRTAWSDCNDVTWPDGHSHKDHQGCPL